MATKTKAGSQPLIQEDMSDRKDNRNKAQQLVDNNDVYESTQKYVTVPIHNGYKLVNVKKLKP